MCYYLVSPRGSDRDMQDALGLKVSQFVSLMGDAQPDGDEAFLRQSEARDRIRRLVERLNDEEIAFHIDHLRVYKTGRDWQ